MGGMFWGAPTFNGDLSKWDVSAVTDMFSMFLGARAYNSDISNWNLKSVSSAGSMFSGAGRTTL